MNNTNKSHGSRHLPTVPSRHCSMCYQHINSSVLPNNSSPDIFSVSVDEMQTDHTLDPFTQRQLMLVSALHGAYLTLFKPHNSVRQVPS